MRYTLLLHYPEMNAADLGPEALAEGMREFDEYAKALDAAGVLQSAEVLQPSSATTTVRGGDELRVQDGPYADTKEQLGGTFVIEVDDLDAGDRAGRARLRRSTGAPSRSVPSARASSTAPGRSSTTDDTLRRAMRARGRGARRARVVRPAPGGDRRGDPRRRARRGRPRRRVREGAADVAGLPASPTTPKGGWSPWHATACATCCARPPRARSAPLLESVLEADERDAAAIVADREQIPDKRLELLFACAHPAIDPGIRTPLMLQVGARVRRGADRARVRGGARDDGAAARPGEAADPRCRHPVRRADASRHAGAAERRARGDLRRVRDRLARAPDAGGGDRVRESIADEARWLAVLLASLLETEPEAWGLAALLTFAQSRAPARAERPWPPLDEQDPALWDAELIAEGRALLRRASALGAPLGRFQLEAAIQAVHCDRARTGDAGCRDPREALPRARRDRADRRCPRRAGRGRGAAALKRGRAPCEELVTERLATVHGPPGRS